MNDFKSYSDGKHGNDGSSDRKENGGFNRADGNINGGFNGGNGRNSANGTNGGKEGNQHKNQTAQSDINSTVEMAKIITAAMNGKSTAQIMRNIISEAERGKREGRLTDADLDNFYNAVYPLLDGAKRKKLKEVIARLKSL